MATQATLAQIIAVKQSVQAEARKEGARLNKLVQVPTPFNGLTKTYQPLDDDGIRYPNEATKVQTNVAAVLEAAAASQARWFDVTLTQEAANATANADVVVDGVKVLESVPVTYLLFLEKALVEEQAFLSKLPVLDPAVDWELDVATGNYRSEPVQTIKSKKKRIVETLAPATDKFQAQVQVFEDTEPEGTWTKVDFSGAIPATRKADLLSRVSKLSQAVKFAREQANATKVTDHKAADKVFGFLYA